MYVNKIAQKLLFFPPVNRICIWCLQTSSIPGGKSQRPKMTSEPVKHRDKEKGFLFLFFKLSVVHDQSNPLLMIWMKYSHNLKNDNM